MTDTWGPLMKKALGALLKTWLAHKWVVAIGTFLLTVWASATNQYPAGVLAGVVAMMMGDAFAGFVEALVRRSLNRQAAFQGVGKLAVYAVLIWIVNELAKVTGLGTLWDLATNALVSLTAISIMLTEAISILEHLRFLTDRAGVNVPVLNILYARLQRELKSVEEAPNDAGAGPPAGPGAANRPAGN